MGTPMRHIFILSLWNPLIHMLIDIQSISFEKALIEVRPWFCEFNVVKH